MGDRDRRRNTLTFVVMGRPIGKPRMTRRDTWMQRPCVVRYRAWCDVIRQQAGLTQKVTFVRPHALRLVAYFEIPKSWPKRLREQALGTPHAQTPDIDNIGKGVMDAILDTDQNIYSVHAQKYWDDGRGPRIEVSLEECA